MLTYQTEDTVVENHGDCDGNDEGIPPQWPDDQYHSWSDTQINFNAPVVINIHNNDGCGGECPNELKEPELCSVDESDE
jgi:hypothetical protein